MPDGDGEVSAVGRVATRLAALPMPLRFGFWMLLSCICFAVLLGLVRYLYEYRGMDVFVISFWRNVFSVLIFLPWLFRNGPGVARSRSHDLLLSRATLMTVSSSAMFFSAALMPIAEATAISFTTPLFSVILAVIFLRERIGPRRLAALAIGMLGVVVILRPGAEAIDPVAALPLFAALTFGGVVVLSKALTTNDSPEAIGFWLAVYMVPISLIPAVFYWHWPDWDHLLWLFALGAAAVGNMYFLTRAVRIGDASQTAPWDFVRLPFVALVGYAAFAQTVDLWVWVGAAIIVASTFYVTWRETQEHRARAKEKAEETGTSP